MVVNKNNDLLVEEKPMDISELREAAVAFLDNGGGKGEDACDFCQGARDKASSDNPEKAVISLKNDRETDYTIVLDQMTLLFEDRAKLKQQAQSIGNINDEFYDRVIEVYSEVKVNPFLKWWKTRNKRGIGI